MGATRTVGFAPGITGDGDGDGIGEESDDPAYASEIRMARAAIGRASLRRRGASSSPFTNSSLRRSLRLCGPARTMLWTAERKRFETGAQGEACRRLASRTPARGQHRTLSASRFVVRGALSVACSRARWSPRRRPRSCRFCSCSSPPRAVARRRASHDGRPRRRRRAYRARRCRAGTARQGTSRSSGGPIRRRPPTSAAASRAATRTRSRATASTPASSSSRARPGSRSAAATHSIQTRTASTPTGSSRGEAGGPGRSADADRSALATTIT